MRRIIASLIVTAALAFAAAPAQAHYYTWGQLHTALWVTNWGGLCGNGANWDCKRRYTFDWWSASGAHSRWVQGSYSEAPLVPPWDPWRTCRVLTRFYHWQLAEIAYRNCA